MLNIERDRGVGGPYVQLRHALLDVVICLIGQKGSIPPFSSRRQVSLQEHNEIHRQTAEKMTHPDILLKRFKLGV